MLIALCVCNMYVTYLVISLRQNSCSSEITPKDSESKYLWNVKHGGDIIISFPSVHVRVECPTVTSVGSFGRAMDED